MRAPAFPPRPVARPAREFILAAMSLLLLAGTGWTQTALEPEQGGADFRIQGEYAGHADDAPMAAQVVALGAGRFKAVFYAGGFPGAGWNGIDRVEAEGGQAGETAGFQGNGYSAEVAADGSRISGKTDKGASFALDKVMRVSPTAGAPAPAGSTVLFDGTGVSAWKEGTATLDARKLFKPEGASATSGAVTKQAFQDFTLHLEFREPFMPSERGIKRGNSGVYLQGRYEIQVLDSFGSDLATGLDTMAPKRECAAIWEHFGPRLNVAFPPLSWQTYDIAFTAARFDAGGNRTAPARVTLLWNGIPVHDKLDMLNRTLAGDLEGASAGPLRFQAYGDSVYYRNIWIAEGVSAIRPRDRWLRGGTGGIRAPSGATGRIFLADGRTLFPKGFAADGTDPSARSRVPRPASGQYFISGPAGASAIPYSGGANHEF